MKLTKSKVIVGAVILFLLILVVVVFSFMGLFSFMDMTDGQPSLPSCGKTMGDSLSGLLNGNGKCYEIYRNRADKCVDEAIDYINENIAGAPHFNVERYGELRTPYADCLRAGRKDCEGYQVIFRYLEYSGTTKVGDLLALVNDVWCDTKDEKYISFGEPCSYHGAKFNSPTNRCEF